MHSSDYIADLLFRHLRRELTPDQVKELNSWRLADPANEQLFKEVNDEETLLKRLQQYHRDKEEVWNNIIQRKPELQSPVAKKSWWKKPLAAAIVIVVFAGSLYWILNRKANTINQPAIVKTDVKPDIPAGTSKAVLTLADGRQLALDSNKQTIPLQVINTVQQSDSGLVYGTVHGEYNVMAFNTLAIPRGGQYQVELADGTKVWLNAASSLRYPVNFSKTDRTVELTGEGYFEVAKNPASPFHVIINKSAKLTVLGTHFDVTAYEEDKIIYASLLEGSVLFQNEVLKPGQQGQLSHNGSVRITPFNEKEVMGWKNGLVQLKDANVESILRVVSRWYDVDIVYQGKIPDEKITGGILRNAPLSEIIKILNLYDVHCRIEGKQLIVTK